MSSEYFRLEDLICVAPALIIFLASLLPITVKVLRNNKEPNTVASLAYALMGVLGAVGVSAMLYTKQDAPYYAFSGALVFDGVSIFASILVALITGCAAIMAREYRATNNRQFAEFLFLLLNSAAGMMILAWSNDLIVTFIAIEIMSLCLYLLIALSHEETLSKEAAFKYFVLGSFASAIFLYGVAFIYGILGTTYIGRIIELAPVTIAENYLFLIGVIFAIVGFCFKLAIVPFHAWAPDVYEGSPTPVTGFMAAGVKVVTFVAFLRFIRGDFITADATGQLVTVLQWLAVLTMVVGNIAAISQNSLKRMLAYSSIAHSGYVMMGLIAAAVGGESWRGDMSVIYYVFGYAIMTIGSFGIVCLLEKNESDVVLVEDLRGLAKRNPWTAFLFALFLLSLAGIPPTIGFFGKFFLFSAAIKQGFFWMVVWAAINSVISAYYYLRPIVLMYMKEEPGVEVADHYRMSHGVITAMAILVVALGLATEPLYQTVMAAINSLF